MRPVSVLALLLAGVLLAGGCGESGAEDASSAQSADEDAFGGLWSDVQRACTSPEVSASLTELLMPWGTTLSFEQGTASDLVCEIRLLDSEGYSGNGYVHAPPLMFTVVEDGPTEEEMANGPLASSTPCGPLKLSDANGSATCEVDGHGLDVSFSFYTKEFTDETNRLSESDMTFLLGAIVDKFVESLDA